MNTATTAAPQLSPGTVIDGTYTTGAVVRERLGAVTYAATDMSDVRVDVTIYAPACFVSPVALERSLRELRQLEKVHVPQVLRVLDAGKLPQGGIYEVHEHTDARPLSDLGAIPPDQVAPLIHEIVAALQAAQKVGVLHRNLGAEAILRDRHGIKVTGFAVGDPQGGVSFGALDCIAPEQVEGKNIDERTLVYNLAALTYRFLRGASLFTGGDNGTQLLQAAASLPPEESMPAPLFAALAKDPKARPNLLARFLSDLDVMVRDFPAAESQAHGSAARDLGQIADASSAGEEREVSDTLPTLMTDPDAPKLPSSDPQAGTAAAAGPATSTPSRPATSPPRPAIITGPGTVGAPPSVGTPRPAPTPGAVPSLGGLPNAPSLGSLGSLAVPSITAPPSLGRPPAPTIGAPSLGAPLTPPGVSAPDARSGAPTVSAPSLGAPVTPPSAAPNAAPNAAAAASGSKPRTRGWTMFMEVTEDEAGGANGGVPLPGGGPTPAAASPTPVAAAPVPAPMPAAAATPAPALAPGEVKPSTRGWTMIMDDPAEAEPAALGASTPVAAAAPPPSPTTRGWTMLEELNDSLPAATPVTPAPAAPEPAPGAAPSSRGWTMFMEAELQGGGTRPEPDAEPEFYDGQVQTDSGTVVAFAPTAADPNGGRPRVEPAAPDLAAQEPMRSFGARLRGGEDDASPTTSTTPATTPASEIPSFAGNKFGDLAVTPVTSSASSASSAPAASPASPASAGPRVEPQPDDLEPLEGAGGGSTKLIVVGLVVVVAIIIAIIMMTRG